MEEIRRLLEESDNSLRSYQSDSDSDNFEMKQFVNRRRNEGERQPTRRPDPNVYNRNAILARENRRKKKAYLEAVESELKEMRAANQALMTAVKKQLKTIKRLEGEKHYFRNILKNHTEIVNLVTALNSGLSQYSKLNTVLCQTSASPVEWLDSNCGQSVGSESGCLGQITGTFDVSSDNGSAVTANFPCALSSNFPDNFFTDFDSSSKLNDTWNELVGDNFGFVESSNIQKSLGAGQYNITSEHSYNASSGNSTNYINESAGICLHITGGKASFEFCPSCHWKSSCTPPQQLLQEDSDTII